MISRLVPRWFPRFVFGALFALLLGIIGISFAHPTAADGPMVSIQGYAFNDATITVPVGTTLTWTNNDTTEHSATSVDSLWDSGKIVPGASFSATFTAPGTYAYYCKYHVFMKAIVIVTDGSASVPDVGNANTSTPATATP